MSISSLRPPFVGASCVSASFCWCLLYLGLLLLVPLVSRPPFVGASCGSASFCPDRAFVSAELVLCKP